MVVACLALLVALGGTGMAAATQLAKNSVGTAQLKDGAVSNPKIRANAINSTKGVEGLCGTVSLNQNRDAVKDATILEVTPEGLKFKARVSPEMTP